MLDASIRLQKQAEQTPESYSLKKHAQEARKMAKDFLHAFVYLKYKIDEKKGTLDHRNRPEKQIVTTGVKGVKLTEKETSNISALKLMGQPKTKRCQTEYAQKATLLSAISPQLDDIIDTTYFKITSQLEK